MMDMGKGKVKGKEKRGFGTVQKALKNNLPKHQGYLRVPYSPHLSDPLAPKSLCVLM